MAPQGAGDVWRDRRPGARDGVPGKGRKSVSLRADLGLSEGAARVARAPRSATRYGQRLGGRRESVADQLSHRVERPPVDVFHQPVRELSIPADAVESFDAG